MADWLIHLLQLALGVGLLIGGADALVRGAITISTRMGVAPLIVGLTVIAFGTSAPELALNIAAALSDNSGLSFGNIVGSNIANIGLILGLCAVFRPMTVNSRLIRHEMPIMVGASAVMIFMFVLPPDATAERPGVARLDGVILLLGFAIFMGGMIRAVLRGKGEAAIDLIQDAAAATKEAKQRSLFMGWSLTIAGLALLIGGGKLSEIGAAGMAGAMGLSDELIGLTVVAVATSLPELAASIMAVRKGQTDLAVGNVVGSNIFNILLVMGATGVVSPVVAPPGSLFSLLAMAALALLIIPMSHTTGRKISRVEGAVLLGVYVFIMYWSVRDALL